MQKNSIVFRRLSLPLVALVILLIALSIYSGVHNPYALATKPASTSPPLTDPAVLQNWLPASSYQFTLARIDDYLTQQKLSATAITVVGGVNTRNFTYNFNIKLLPSNQVMPVTVTVNNYSPTLSEAVNINGTAQLPTE